MHNPWHDLPAGPPFVAPVDVPIVSAFNQSVGRRSPHHLQVDLVPEPWMGDPRRARVVLLLLNPGYVAADRPWHARSEYRAAARASARLERAAHRAYLLDPRWAQAPGGRWWRKRLRVLAESVGPARDDEAMSRAWKRLANRIAAVEFHGYHSVGHRPLPVTLPTQHFGFGLVRAAIERGALVVVTRGWFEWSVAVPELRAGLRDGQVFRLASPQSTYITPGNLGGPRVGLRNFERLVAAIR